MAAENLEGMAEYQEDEYQEVGLEGEEEDEDEDEDAEGVDDEALQGNRGLSQPRYKGSGRGGPGGRFHRPAADDSDDEQADRDQQLLQEACLPVSGAPMPPSDGPPKDADEYLRQVQWERMHCPEVVDVDVPERPHKDGRERRRGVGGGLLARLCASEAHEADAPAHCAAWARDAADAFRELRAHCDARRRRTRTSGTQGKMTFASWRAHCTQKPPASELLERMDFVSLNRLVVVSVENLVRAQEASPEGAATVEADVPEVHHSEVAPVVPLGDAPPEGAAAASAQRVRSLDLESLDGLVEWTFAALTFVEEPIVDDIQFQLQQLRRVCHKLLAGARELGGDPGSQGILARASLLLVVVTEVFGQR